MSILEGAREAEHHARVTRVIHDWIRDDLGIAAKMTIMPDQVFSLVDRLTGSTTHNVNATKEGRGDGRD